VVTGTMGQWTGPERSFAFIKMDGDSGNDLFVHQSSIEGDKPKKGDKVKFLIITEKRADHAGRERGGRADRGRRQRRRRLGQRLGRRLGLPAHPLPRDCDVSSPSMSPVGGATPTPLAHGRRRSQLDLAPAHGRRRESPTAVEAEADQQRPLQQPATGTGPTSRAGSPRSTL
jgi:cold shock CspA family protein